MRLTTVILIASLMQVSAAGFAQRVTLNRKNTTLQQVFKEISRQTGYALFYDARILPKNHKIDIVVKDASIDEALKSTIKGLPLSYEINEKEVLIKKKEEATLIDNVIARFQSIDIKGKVADSLGNGIGGATITVKGIKLGTTSAANGDFYLKNVEETTRLVVSCLGYITKEVAINKEFNYVMLQQSSSKLDEVQVIAYGKTSKRLSTGNIATISADDIEKSPVTNALAAIQGRVPGIFVEQSSGFSGSGFRVRIQGQNNINSGNQPLYVVDGVPYPASFLGKVNEIQGDSGSPLNFINPGDIQSISILKVRGICKLGIWASWIQAAAYRMEPCPVSQSEESFPDWMHFRKH